MHCSSLQLKVFATILFVAANAMNQANAQTSAPAPEDTILLPTPQPIKIAMPHLEAGEKLILITSKDPAAKRTCRLESTTADEIHCRQHTKTQPATYRIADLEAIIQPAPSRWNRLTFIFPLAIGGSMIWGACLLAKLTLIALIGAVPIGILGAVFVGLSIAIATDTGDYKSATVLYQKPATTLAVNIR
jgi:hypothetical protein